jgi:hypothetical protein
MSEGRHSTGKGSASGSKYQPNSEPRLQRRSNWTLDAKNEKQKPSYNDWWNALPHRESGAQKTDLGQVTMPPEPRTGSPKATLPPQLLT